MCTINALSGDWPTILLPAFLWSFYVWSVFPVNNSQFIRNKCSDKKGHWVCFYPGPQAFCLHRFMDSHYKDKMVVRPSYIHNGNFHTCTTVSLYWYCPRVSSHFIYKDSGNYHLVVITGATILIPFHPDKHFYRTSTHKWNFGVPGFNFLKPGDAYMCHWNGSSLGSGNGLLPTRHQAITWTDADLLSIWTLETNFSKF